MDRTNASYEAEIKIVCISPDREGIFRRLAKVHEIGGYLLGEAHERYLNDTYFLRDRVADNFAVRMRKWDGETLFALKGPSVKNEWGALERLEIEAPWSWNLLSSIMDALGVDYQRERINRDSFENETPLALLKTLGFEQVQQRRTKRVARSFFLKRDHRTATLGEMALDTVIFSFAPREFLHYELELEQTGKSGGKHLETLSKLIMETYPKSFIPWEHDKLTTGLALDKLMERGSLNPETDQKELTSDNYSRISVAIGAIN